MSRTGLTALATVAAWALCLGLLPIGAETVATSPVDIATLLDRHVEALGGRERLDAIRSVRGVGTFETPLTQQPLPFVQEQKAPDRLRFETLGGAMVLASTGDEAWELDPEIGTARRLPQAQGNRYQRQAMIGGPLLRAHRSGLALRATGRAARDGRDVHVLTVEYPNGDRARFYLDAVRYLLVGFDDLWRIEDQEIEVAVTLGDYRPVAGVQLPFRVEQQTSQGWRRFAFERVEANPVLDDERFAFPAR